MNTRDLGRKVCTRLNRCSHLLSDLASLLVNVHRFVDLRKNGVTGGPAVAMFSGNFKTVTPAAERGRLDT